MRGTSVQIIWAQHIKTAPRNRIHLIAHKKAFALRHSEQDFQGVMEVKLILLPAFLTKKANLHPIHPHHMIRMLSVLRIYTVYSILKKTQDTQTTRYHNKCIFYCDINQFLSSEDESLIFQSREQNASFSKWPSQGLIVCPSSRPLFKSGTILLIRAGKKQPL